MSAASPKPTGAKFLLIPGGLVAVFLLQALVFWGFGVNQGRSWFDEHHFHLPTIRQFAQTLPAPNLADYASATTPGFHLSLAAIDRVVGLSPLALRVIGSGWTFAMLAAAGALVARSARVCPTFACSIRDPQSTALAAILVLPLACSMYVVWPGVYLAPDNAGWLAVFAVVLLALDVVDRPRIRRLLCVHAPAALVLLWALVWLRQSHLWAWGVVMAAAWLAAAPPRGSVMLPYLHDLRRRILGVAVATAVGLPALAQLAWFRSIWGGLTPPRFQAQHGSGINLATPAFALALVAVFSVFFWPWLWPSLKRMWRDARWVLMLAALIGLGVAVIAPTTYLYEPRSSGLWNLVRIEQEGYGLVIAGRTSPLMLVLSTAGAVCLAAWLLPLRADRRLLMLATFVGFEIAQTANSNAWQRYQEPMLLLYIPMLVLMGGVSVDRALVVRSALASGRPPIWASLGPIVLCLLLLALSIHGIRTAPPEAREGFQEHTPTLGALERTNPASHVSVPQ